MERSPNKRDRARMNPRPFEFKSGGVLLHPRQARNLKSQMADKTPGTDSGGPIGPSALEGLTSEFGIAVRDQR
jgi:hypothetical protein